MTALELYFAGPKAGLDIYSVSSEADWIEGQGAISKVRFGIACVILSIIFIFVAIFATTPWKIGIGILFGLILAGQAAYAFIFVDEMASMEYQRFNTEVEGTARNLGIPREQAIYAVRDQKLQRERNVALATPGATQSGGFSSGLGGAFLGTMIANKINNQ